MNKINVIRLIIFLYWLYKIKIKIENKNMEFDVN